MAVIPWRPSDGRKRAAEVHAPAGSIPRARPWRYRFHGQEDNSFPLMVTPHCHSPSWSSQRAPGSPVLSGYAHLNILQPKQTNHASPLRESSPAVLATVAHIRNQRHLEASCPSPINSNSLTLLDLHHCLPSSEPHSGLFPMGTLETASLHSNPGWLHPSSTQNQYAVSRKRTLIPFLGARFLTLAQ